MVRVYEFQPGCVPSDTTPKLYATPTLGILERREVYVRPDTGSFVVVYRPVGA